MVEDMFVSNKPWFILNLQKSGLKKINKERITISETTEHKEKIYENEMNSVLLVKLPK